MVEASALYGSQDYRAGKPMRTISSGSIQNGSLTGSINIASGQGLIDHLDITGIVLSAASGMTTGWGLDVDFTITVDGNVAGTNLSTDLYPFIGTGETSVIKSEHIILPINTRYNTSFNISWVATVLGSRIQSSHITTLRLNGITY